MDPPPPILWVAGVVGGGGVVVGVGPDVTGLAQGVVPAKAGASLLAPSGSTRTSAVSVRPRSSLTVRRTVIEPLLGATIDAIDEFAPVIAGGLMLGETTVQA